MLKWGILALKMFEMQNKVVSSKKGPIGKSMLMYKNHNPNYYHVLGQSRC